MATYLERPDRAHAIQINAEDRAQARRELEANVKAALPPRVELLLDRLGEYHLRKRGPNSHGTVLEATVEPVDVFTLASELGVAVPEILR